MKLFFSLLLASSLGTAAAAGLSDREADIRLDTSKKVTQAAAPEVTPTLSTRSAKKPTFYAYAQPYGVGPYNDSR